MYLGIDIGGTKTLIASFGKDGKILSRAKFPTNQTYGGFLADLDSQLKLLGKKDFRAACVAIPGKIERKTGTVIAFGNIGWHNATLKNDLEDLLKCPVMAENDANLAGLSEARVFDSGYKKILYITISTGIGTGVITNGIIDPSFADSEGGHIVLEHKGKRQIWESFASGKAIVERFGKPASQISDQDTWRIIAHDLAIGILDLVAVIQPDAIIIGGGVGSHFSKFIKPLESELGRFETPIAPLPPIRQAKHAQEAVVYGCYYLLEDHYGS